MTATEQQQIATDLATALAALVALVDPDPEEPSLPALVYQDKFDAALLDAREALFNHGEFVEYEQRCRRLATKAHAIVSQEC